MAHSVTLRAIAAKIGYSKNTVSLALRGDTQIPEPTRDRICKVAQEMGYRPNALVSQLMAQLRAGQNTARFQAKLALVNAHRSPDAFKCHPTVPTYVWGCQKRAAELGYTFDTFWLHDPELTAERWIRILTARGIKGIIIVGLMHQNRLPDHLRSVWDHFPTVVTGVRTRDPSLPFSCVDHFHLMLSAFEKALELGYRRPALVIDDMIDRLVERRFSASMQTSQERLPENQRVPTFMSALSEPADAANFHRWLDLHRPDVIFTLYNDVVHRLAEKNLFAPRDIGLVQLEWRASQPQIAGMHQHNDTAGEAAVDMLIHRIHHNEQGVPDFPFATFIGATWMDGASVRARRAMPPKPSAAVTVAA